MGRPATFAGQSKSGKQTMPQSGTSSQLGTTPRRQATAAGVGDADREGHVSAFVFGSDVFGFYVFRSVMGSRLVHEQTRVRCGSREAAHAPPDPPRHGCRPAGLGTNGLTGAKGNCRGGAGGANAAVHTCKRRDGAGCLRSWLHDASTFRMRREGKVV